MKSLTQLDKSDLEFNFNLKTSFDSIIRINDK
jgi:hypothetical protein